MKKSFFVLAASMAFVVIGSTSHAQDQKVKRDTQKIQKQDTTSQKLGSTTPMDPTKDIVDNASKSPNYTVLVSVFKAAGLVDTLKSDGPFTVFAPSNDAFSKLPQGTIDTVSTAGKTKLVDIVKYHVVPGKLTSQDLALAISRGNGKTTLITVSGEPLVLSINAERNLQIKDEKGNIALVTKLDAAQSNGVIHAINSVLQPEK